MGLYVCLSVIELFICYVLLLHTTKLLLWSAIRMRAVLPYVRYSISSSVGTGCDRFFALGSSSATL